MPTDHLGDGAGRHALFRDSVQHRSRWGLLQRQTEQASGIEPVHSGPAVRTIADVAGDALLTGDSDQGLREAASSFVVN